MRRNIMKDIEEEDQSQPNQSEALQRSGDETSKLHERLDSAFAMMYYSCALRSSIVEDIYAEDFWKQASEFLSGWMPPNRKKLMGPLLNVSHRHMKMQVNQALALSRSDVYVTISLDGWSNPRRQAIINVMVSNGTVTFFHHSVDATGKTKDAPYVASIINNAITQVGDLYGDESRAAVACVVTDNAEVMSTSWDLVYNENPQVVCVGCSAHGFSLMYQDVMAIPWVKQIVEAVRAVSMKFRNIEQLNDMTHSLSQRPKEEGGVGSEMGLILFGETRMVSTLYMLERYITLLPVLRAIINKPFITGEGGVHVKCKYKNGAFRNVLKTIKNDRQNDRIQKFIEVIMPIKLALKLMDHACHSTSKVYPAYLTIKENLVKWSPWSGGSTIRSEAIDAIESRWEWMEFNIHYFCFATDPEFHSHECGMRVIEGVKAVLKQWASSEADYLESWREFNNFKEASLDLDHARAVHPKQFWRLGEGLRWPSLRVHATKGHSCGTVSSSCERNWSDWKHVYNERFSLGIEAGSKLVYLYGNAREKAKQNGAFSEKHTPPSHIRWNFMKI